MSENSDFKELLKGLSAESVRFLLVGAHAVAYHAEPRYTKDFDIWIEPTPTNAERVWRALAAFGAPLADTRPEDFANPEMVYQMGVAPNRVDFMMGLDGVTFEKAWRSRVRSTYGGVPFQLIGRDDLIRNKLATGRPQDLLDVANLRAARRPRKRSRKRPS